MKKNLKKMASYYRPYMKIFLADLFFALGAAAVSLIVPLVVRFITSEVVYRESGEAFQTIMKLGIVLLALIVGQMYCNYFIAN